MKAFHKYHKAAKNGNKEAQRRIAQAHGYKPTVLDNPRLIALLKRADINIHHPLYSDQETLTL